MLDTWFSSALWPFATLGWPDDTPELRRYYPGDVNSTAREIIFLWVNRMIMAGLELMGDIPFHDVIIHSTILAPDGRRMSKTLGHRHRPGRADRRARRRRDALRAAEDVVDAGRALLDGADRGGTPAREQALEREPAACCCAGGDEVDARPSSLEERWILARIDATRAEVERDFDAYDFAHAVDRLYHLTFDDFCDWYLESIKPRLAASRT